MADLLRQGHRSIRAVDLKSFDEWYQRFPEVENLQLDLQDKGACEAALHDARRQGAWIDVAKAGAWDLPSSGEDHVQPGTTVDGQRETKSVSWYFRRANQPEL